MSIPEEVYRATAALARRLGVSKSALYTRAVEEFIDQHEDDIGNVNPLIRANVEPVLTEELSRLSRTPASPPSAALSPAPEHAENPTR